MTTHDAATTSGRRWSLLLHSMATPDVGPLGCLESAHQLGLDGIELIVDDEYPSAVRPDAGNSDVTQIVGAAGDLNLRVAALCPYTRDIDAETGRDRRRAADELRRSIDLAAEFGAQHVRVLGGNDRPETERRDAMRRAAQTLAEVGGYAQRAGVNLNVENHMNTLATTARATHDLVAAASSPGVGILYDQANLAIMKAENPASAVQTQAPYIRHVHLKNFVPTDDGRRPVGLDAGQVNWHTTLHLLRSYGGTMTFEYERRWFRHELPPVESVLANDRDLVVRIATYLDHTEAAP